MIVDCGSQLLSLKNIFWCVLWEVREFRRNHEKEFGQIWPSPRQHLSVLFSYLYEVSTCIYVPRVVGGERRKGNYQNNRFIIYFHSLFYATATGVLVRHTLSTTLASVGCNTLCNLRLISTKYSKVFWKIAHRLISLSLPFSVKTLLFPALTHDTRDILPMLASQSFHALTFSDILYFVASPSKLE